MVNLKEFYIKNSNSENDFTSSIKKILLHVKKQGQEKEFSKKSLRAMLESIK